MVNVTGSVVSRSMSSKPTFDEPGDPMNQQLNTGRPPLDVGPVNQSSRSRLSWIIPLAATLLVALPLTVMKLI
jgi:hypothetical protein